LKPFHGIFSPPGAVLTDTSLTANLDSAVIKIKSAGDRANELAGVMNDVVVTIKQDMQNGKGKVNALLRDSLMVTKINSSLDNIQKGTDAFSQNMEALKHNFLFRGYFKKLEKEKLRASKQHVVIH
jgi:phospholipid/cholesterol/gamma-HCH transport system substrate-binding protein